MRTVGAIVMLAAAAAAQERTRAAVLDFTASGVEPEAAVSFTRLLSAEIAKAGKMETVGREDLAALLGVEKMRQLVGCAGEACLSEFGQYGAMLDVQWVVTGTLGKVGTVIVVSAQMIDAARARVQSRAVRRAPSIEQLASEAERLARELLAEPATLHLYNQVPSAKVLVDDRYVGAMPLDPLPLALSGVHRVRAESADHLPWEAEVELVPGRTARVRVEMDRLDELEARSRARKWWAAGALVLGAALGTGSYLSMADGASLAEHYDRLDPRRVTQGQLDELASRARLRYGGGYGLAAAALGALAGGVYLLLTDPHAERLAGTR